MTVSLQKMVVRIGIIVMAAALVWRGGSFLLNSQQAILYPFELDYGEGIVWQQAVMIVEGRGYGDITRYPFIVFHYPPVYHLLAIATAKLSGLDQLMAGRLLSFMATLAAVICAGLISRRLAALRTGDARYAWLCGVVTTAVCLTFTPIQVWAPLMRVDMVALAFTMGGVLFALRSIDRPREIYFACALFVLAVYTRQTMISAPAACFLVLMAYNRKTSLQGIGGCIAMGIIPLIYLCVSTDGLFIEHIISYNVNRYTLARLAILPSIIASFSIYVTIAMCCVVGLAVLASRYYRSPDAESDKRRIAAMSIVLLYFLFSSLTLILVGKSGSNLNYLVEWAAVCAILVGLAMPNWNGTKIAEDAKFPDRLKRFDFIVPLAIAFYIFTNAFPSYAIQIARPPSFAMRYRLIEDVRRMDKPVLSDDMVLLMRAGKQVPYESAIFAELSSQKRWNSELITRLIEQGRFGMVFTHGDRGTPLYNDRYLPAVSNAIDKAYPRKIPFGQFVIHAPLRH